VLSRRWLLQSNRAGTLSQAVQCCHNRTHRMLSHCFFIAGHVTFSCSTETKADCRCTQHQPNLKQYRTQTWKAPPIAFLARFADTVTWVRIDGDAYLNMLCSGIPYQDGLHGVVLVSVRPCGSRCAIRFFFCVICAWRFSRSTNVQPKHCCFRG